MLESIDSLIATIAIVLVLSLIVQAIQQILKQILSMKSAYMERELVMMFLDNEHLTEFLDKQKNILNKIIPQWLTLRSIPKNQRQLVEELKVKMASIGYKDLEMIESLSVEQFLSVLRSLPSFSKIEKGVADKLKDIEYEVVKWFDICKKSFQDHYERRMKLWAFVLSAIVVIGLNANLLNIYKEFSVNKSLRNSMIASVPALLNTAGDKIASSSSAGQLSDTQRDSIVKCEIAFIESTLSKNNFEILRWNNTPQDSIKGSIVSFRKGDFWDCLYQALLRNWLGWIGMILLVSLGSPFWYDFLKTLMGIKNSFRSGNGSGENKTDSNTKDDQSKPDKKIPAAG